MQETRVPPLGCEYSLENEMITHSSILTWEIPWTEEPGGLPSMGSQRDMTEHTAPKGGKEVGRHQEEETGLGWPDLGLSPDCPSALGSLGSQPGTLFRLHPTHSWEPSASFRRPPTDSPITGSQHQSEPEVVDSWQPLLRVSDVWFW